MNSLTQARSAGDHPAQLFELLARQLAGERPCALVTIVKIVGTAARSLGGHMLVPEVAEPVGSVSSGCVDATVAAMAHDCLRTGERRRVQLGADSPFVDLRLPCGGGLELLIVPNPPLKSIIAVRDSLAQRRPCGLRITPKSVEFLKGEIDATGWKGNDFIVEYRPRLRLILAGRGPELRAFCRIALAAGFEVLALGPDAPDLEACAGLGAEARLLGSATEAPELSADPWTSVVLLYHDHDWEPALLEAALATEAFYIGALGSRRTQETRLALLRERGVPEADLARIRGPIGLVPSMRNAPMLAISALAEIVGEFNGQA